MARPAFTGWHPRVAIDEAHNNFHTAEGRYKPFADLVSNDGCVVSRNTGPLDAQALGRCDVLVIANASVPDAGGDATNPSSAFTDEECWAVQRWVWEGGSLLLITDHEPFGSASVALARRFGVVMNNSGTTDPANDDQKTGGLNFSRERGLILDHPITIGRDPSERINRVMTFYGQAVYGPVGSTPFLRFSDTATYESPGGEQSAAGWAQGVALSYGAGRVVVMGEAAELSAQLAGLEPMGMNVPGIDNRQMALNIMQWLSRQLERLTGVAPSELTYRTPQRRRLFPRLFTNRRAALGTGVRRRWRVSSRPRGRPGPPPGNEGRAVLPGHGGPWFCGRRGSFDLSDHPVGLRVGRICQVQPDGAMNPPRHHRDDDRLAMAADRRAFGAEIARKSFDALRPARSVDGIHPG